MTHFNVGNVNQFDFHDTNVIIVSMEKSKIDSRQDQLLIIILLYIIIKTKPQLS